MYRGKRTRRFGISVGIVCVVALAFTAVCQSSTSRSSGVPKQPETEAGYAYNEIFEPVTLTSDSPVETEIVSDEYGFPYYKSITLEYELQEMVWAACEETGSPYELALAVIFRESSYQNVNGDNGNSVGYMQIQPRWQSERMERLGVTDLSDPQSNFRVGCDLLAELIEKYESVEAALTCYNTGSPGTSGYADRVLEYMNETFFAEEANSE